MALQYIHFVVKYKGIWMVCNQYEFARGFTSFWVIHGVQGPSLTVTNKVQQVEPSSEDHLAQLPTQRSAFHPVEP